jgi:DNA-binding transcriptional LysR family regulator
MHRGHRLARARRIALADLVDEHLLCFSPAKGITSIHGGIIRRNFADRGLKLGAIRQIDGVEAFRATLESGVGISLIAESGSLSQSAYLILKPIKENHPPLEIELHALWRSNQDSQIVDNFIAVMKAVAPRRKPRAG